MKTAGSVGWPSSSTSRNLNTQDPGSCYPHRISEKRSGGARTRSARVRGRRSPPLRTGGAAEPSSGRLPAVARALVGQALAFGVPDLEAAVRRAEVGRELSLEGLDLAVELVDPVLEPPLLRAEVPAADGYGGAAVLAGH